MSVDANDGGSADIGAGDYTASVWTEDGVFDRGAEFPWPTGGWRSPAGLRTPSITGRSSSGSRICRLALCADHWRHGVRDFLFADPRAFSGFSGPSLTMMSAPRPVSTPPPEVASRPPCAVVSNSGTACSCRVSRVGKSRWYLPLTTIRRQSRDNLSARSYA
jgi:hypothetical protein